MIGECSICHDYVLVVKVESITDGKSETQYLCKVHFADFYISKLEKMFDERIKDQEK